MPGFDWFANMDAVNIDELGWALEGERPPHARSSERRLGCWNGSRTIAKVISDEVELSEADRVVMASPERHEAIRNGINEAFRQGVWGYVDDIFCLIQPWGFEVTEIRVPTRVLYGLTDVPCPASMASGSLTTCPTPRSSSMNRAATCLIPTSSRNDSAGLSSRSDALHAAPLKMTEAAAPTHDWRSRAWLSREALADLGTSSGRAQLAHDPTFASADLLFAPIPGGRKAAQPEDAADRGARSRGGRPQQVAALLEPAAPSDDLSRDLDGW